MGGLDLRGGHHESEPPSYLGIVRGVGWGWWLQNSTRSFAL